MKTAGDRQMTVRSGLQRIRAGSGWRLHLEQGLARARAAQEQEREAIEASVEAAEGWTTGLRGLATSYTVWGRLGDKVMGWSDTVESGGKRLKALDAELAAHEAILSRTEQATLATADAKDKETAADKASAEAKAKATKAAAEAVAWAKEQAAVLERVQGVTRSATQAQLEGADLVAAKRDYELQKLDETAVKYKDSQEIVAEVEAARVAVIAAAEAEIAEIRAKSAEDQAAERERQKKEAEDAAEDAKDRAQKAADEAQAITQAYGSAASDIAGSVGDALSAVAEGMAETNREAALVAFAVAKAAALAQVAIDTAMAVSAVNAAWAAVPPVAAALSAAAIATGAVQAGIIASEQPQFHTGGMLSASGPMAPDERSTKTLVGEGYLNRAATAMLGEQGVNDLNAGRMPGGSVTVVQKYKHKVLDRVVYDSVRMPDSSLRAAVKGKTRVGHRSR